MKVLLAGHWNWEIYEEAFKNGLKANGHDVVKFSFSDYYNNMWFKKLQIRLKVGPLIKLINQELISAVNFNNPDILFMHQSDLIFPKTIRKIKKLNVNIKVKIYHNDNPYRGIRNALKWRHFLATIRTADHLFVYRPENVADGRRLGCNSISIIMPSYVSYLHYPVFEDKEKIIDVIFVGHFEPDGRDEYIDFLKQNGVNVEVYGTGWTNSGYNWAKSESIRLLGAEEYTKILSSAKIALVFLSKINRDVWTRRCFEITACRTLMMAQRTSDLEKIWSDGVEAIFFDSKEDLLRKTLDLLQKNDEIYNIASCGYVRCISYGNSEIDRSRQIIED